LGGTIVAAIPMVAVTNVDDMLLPTPITSVASASISAYNTSSTTATDHIQITAYADRVKQLGQVKLTQSHRLVSFVNPARSTSKITPVPPRWGTLKPSYTTSRDVP
jgi:hypothetical protein